MRTSLVRLVAVTALLAPSLSTGDAALTCPYRFQSRVGSTLSNPPVASLSSSSGLADADGSGSGRSDDEVGTKKPSMSGSDASSGSGMKEVGSSDKGDSDAGSDAGDDAGAGTTMTPPPTSTSPSPSPSTTPPATTETPATTTEAPTSAPTPTTASTSPEATTDAPTSTPSATPTTVTEAPTSTPSTRPTATTEAPTETPTTETPAASPTPPTVSASATPDVTTAAPTATPSAGSTVGLVNTTRLAAVRRSLQRTNTTTTTLAPAVTTSPVAANNTTNGSVGNTTSVPSTTARTVVPAVASNGTAASNSTASSGSGNTTTTIVDSFTCDETFYEQWETLGITCGGVNIDVSAAVAAASCVIYSGALGSIAGSTCVSICAFPACVNKKWQYGASNGIASDVYKNVGIASFLPSDVAAGVSSRLTGAPVMVGNTTFKSTQQCSYTSEDSFSPCSCSALSATTNVTDAQIKRQREADVVNGVISMDDTSSAGSVLAPTTQTVAGVTVIVSAVAVITSSTVGGVSVASASVSALGANVGVWTIEICQFGVMINQMKLEGKSAALSLFGKQLAPAAFTFLPFGKLDSNEPSTLSKGRRLTEDAAGSHRGIAQYSRTLGIREDMLFLVTLAGVVVVMAGVLMLFGVAYGLAGLFMAREDFMAQFFDKMIGLLVLAAILSQYTIGVTATYQIYYSSNLDELSDPKCVLAILSLIVLALGIMLYGYIVIKRHEDDLRDVGTHTHINKKVCQRYGPFYDEYKFKNRYFFAAKMMLALVTGVATGYAGLQARYQVTFALAAYAIYFLYLEVQSPHHSKFVQTTTSFVTIMKIAVLALTFFLIDSTTASYMPSELQNGISLAIVGLNLFVLFLLMVRALYSLWKKYRLQKDAHYDEDEDQTVASDCAKDESETGKPGDSKPSQSPTHQISNLQETPIGGLGYFETPVQRSSVGNPRQPYTASTREPYAPSPQVSRPNHTPGNRRNDVIEL